MISLRWLIFLIVFTPRLLWAETFTPESNALIQQALTKLGYPLGAIDGQWGQGTSAAVRHYRYDFGLSDDKTLSMAEANAVIDHANWLDSATSLTYGENPRHTLENDAQATELGTFEPEPLLYASERHALAALMLERPAYWNKLDNTLRAKWTAEKKQRILALLSSDLERIPSSYKYADVLRRSLLKIDIALSGLDHSPTRADTVESVFPNLATINTLLPDANFDDTLKLHTTERLFRDIGRALSVAQCDPTHPLENNWVDLAIKVSETFEQYYPGARYLQGRALQIARCADPKTRFALLRDRNSLALKSGDLAASLDVLSQSAAAFYEYNEEAAAREIYRLLLSPTFDALPDKRQDMIELNSNALIDLGMKDVVGPLLLARAQEMLGKKFSSNATLGEVVSVTTQLMRLGYGFDVTDRLFFETENRWREEGDIYLFYWVMVRSIINDGNGAEALASASALADRAQVEGRLDKAEEFKAFQIETLLELGRFAEAEGQIAAYAEMTRQGTSDPHVAQWRARLNLDASEGLSPGRAYATQMTAYVEGLCRGDADLMAPSVDRHTAYSDPEFLTAAQELGLSSRIEHCEGQEWAYEIIDRTGCYLWVKEENAPALTAAMQRWLTAARKVNDDAPQLMMSDEGMNCPFGIAEAGRMDLIASFVSQLGDPGRNQALALLMLSVNHDTNFARSMLERFGQERSGLYDVRFPSIEAMERLRAPSDQKLREMSKYAFIMYNSGAAADNAEIAAIRTISLDLAQGYAAMDLLGIAKYFLEIGAPEQFDALATAQVLDLLDDAELSRFALLRGQIALKQGDIETALEFSRPVLAAFSARVRQGEIGSIEDLGAWSRRLHDFAEHYLATLATNPGLLAAEPPQAVLDAQQVYAAATSAGSAGRLSARLSSSAPELARRYQDALKGWRGAMQAGDNERIVQMRKQVSELSNELAQRDPAFGASAGLSMLTLETIRANARNHVLVLTTSLPTHLLVTTIGPDSIDLRATALPRDSLAAQIDRFRATIQAEQDVATPDGISLSQAMLAGLSRDGLPAALAIVVDGPLVRLPMGALPLMMKDQRSYLGAETALSILPALSTLAPRTQTEQLRAPEPFLGIGDTQVSQAGGLARFGFAPPELRETNAELRFMGALLGANIGRDLILGTDATEARIRQMSQSGQLARYRTITFATHGFMEGQGRIEEPSLMLSEPPAGDDTQDGLLSASEIYDLKLNADLVELSACDTAAVKDSSRGLSDLVRAFTYAGARNLIVTHWEIDTHAATELSKLLATQMKNAPNQSPAQNLQYAVRTLLETPAAARFHAPKYWASHAVVGY